MRPSDLGTGGQAFSQPIAFPGAAPRPSFIIFECPVCHRRVEVLEGALGGSCSKSPTGAEHKPARLQRLP